MGAAAAAAAILSSSGAPVAAALLPVRNEGEKITNFYSGRNKYNSQKVFFLGPTIARIEIVSDICLL